MERDWLLCSRCPCSYRGDVREEGERCDDLSWLPDAVYRIRRVGVRMARRLTCKGRIRREGVGTRWTDAELLGWRTDALVAVGILTKGEN